MKKLLFLLLIIFSLKSFGRQTEQKDSLSLIFIGDIMRHVPQIKSALDSATGEYNYMNVFEKVAPLIQSADFAVANLEVTLAGKPYSGYPSFSSPAQLAYACKESGIDVLVTANNHCCDKGKRGILGTINALDSLKILHTGTFKDSLDRANNNLLILRRNNINVGILNYTYGTNGISIPKPTCVNKADTLTMLSDIKNSKTFCVDKLIVVIHWGAEYESSPSQRQIKIANFLFRNGVDIIIGSHPHVIQKMEYGTNEEFGEYCVAYSLGNFVSDQRKRKTNGGVMLKIMLTKENDKVKISDVGYYLTWVHKTIANGKSNYKIIWPSPVFKVDN